MSRCMSYLLRHDPGKLKMDQHGFVDIGELLQELRERYRIDEKFIVEVVEKSDRRRFEIVGNKIRALYGHTIPVKLEFEEDEIVKLFYHGTTPEAASRILRIGLKPMRRSWVHLSPTIEMATEVGLRRTMNPVILEINAEAARKNSLRFYKVTDKVYVCNAVLPRYLKKLHSASAHS